MGGEEEILEKVSSLSPEEKIRLYNELKQLLKADKERITPEAEALLKRLDELKKEMSEIRQKLKQLGVRIRRIENTPLYNAVKQILADHGVITIDELAEELKKRGYKFSGGAYAVLRHMRNAALIDKVGKDIIWRGGEQA